jgi:general secretion pathway protein I
VVFSRSAPGGSRGFSLLEMVVAVAIMGISLSALYQAAGGATRTVAIDEKMAYGVELARSLLATHAVVPVAGLHDSGETEGGFAWEVVAEPVTLSDEDLLPEGMLQNLQITVRWPDGAKERQFVLYSVVAGEENGK